MSDITTLMMAAAGQGGGGGANPNAWNIFYASYSNDSFSVAAQESQPRGLFFKTDGTKMYISGTAGDDVNEYNLSTAWDITTASYLQTFSVANEDTTPRGLFFKTDGTKMYVVGGGGQDINEYNLSSAWDISTSSFLQAFSINAQDTAPAGIFFRSDGVKMYIVGDTGNDINEYTLSTPWDVSTASFLQNFSVASQDTGPAGLYFKDDGTKMYVTGFTDNDSLYEYSLSTAWDISSASYVTSLSVASQETAPEAVFFKSDGVQFWIVGRTADSVFSYLISPT